MNERDIVVIYDISGASTRSFLHPATLYLSSSQPSLKDSAGSESVDSSEEEDRERDREGRGYGRGGDDERSGFRNKKEDGYKN